MKYIVEIRTIVDANTKAEAKAEVERCLDAASLYLYGYEMEVRPSQLNNLNKDDSGSMP